MNYLYLASAILVAFGLLLIAIEISFKIKQKERIKNLEDHQRFFNKQFKKWWER